MAEWSERKMMRRRMLLKTSGIQAPTIQASNIGFSSVQRTAMNVSWTRGNGQFCIVLCRASVKVPSNPLTDNVIYSANSDYTLAQTVARAKVLYIGTGNSFIATGLTKFISYDYKICEFNCMGGLIKYLQTTAFYNPRARFTLR